jgi:alkanesulfonate monooxygenase SsuD/methylene tetrahydromethanopterin reductase-like flavin-dependent oxidoreductase (luciferase family)
VEIGIGLDPSLGLTWDQQRDMASQAAELGYTSAWTPAGATGRDAFFVCAQWNAATTGVRSGGIGTGISVVPVPTWSPTSLASLAGTVGELTGGRFSLGIGTGGIYSQEFRHTYGAPAYPPIAMMRDYLTATRALLAGEKLDYSGPSVDLHGVQLAFRPPHVPVLLGALGPQMLRLAGEAADGAALNWCTPEQIAYSRQRVDAGAARAGRDPSAIQLVEYIRVCVDEDESVARRAYTRAMLGYALGRVPGANQSGYRAHFGRMGFEDELTRLETERAKGMPQDELIDAFPRELALQVGYFGPAKGAAAAFRSLSQGLDVAIVRVVAARPGVEAVQAVMRACAPQVVQSA